MSNVFIVSDNCDYWHFFSCVIDSGVAIQVRRLIISLYVGNVFSRVVLSAKVKSLNSNPGATTQLTNE